MKVKTWSFLPVVAFLLATTVALAFEAAPGVGPDAALQRLLEGNRSFVANRLTIKESSAPAKRLALASGQHPYAVILSCSDSRVPPEIIFNKGLGELFVVRDAGNVVDPLILGSIEYAVEHLGSSLIMVLGHSRCGAVKAALDATGHEDPNVGAIIKRIAPAVQLARKEIKGKDKSGLYESAIDFNIKLSAQALLSESPIIRSLVDSGKVRIVCAEYDVQDGTVKTMSCKMK
ncbi:MAG: carbonic anhydrase [Syntrophobacteraceae bacterium]|nr:carbonic anhydrase [Syntrophobacteraceae bacterium]